MAQVRTRTTTAPDRSGRSRLSTRPSSPAGRPRKAAPARRGARRQANRPDRKGRRRRATPDAVVKQFALDGSTQAWSILVMSVDRGGAGTSVRAQAMHLSDELPAGTTAIRRVRSLGSRARQRRLCRYLAGAAHPHRLAVLVKLLEGPATYKALQKTTGQKSGPLYHHVNQLRIAGLVAPAQRDLYQLTPAGRAVVAMLLCGFAVTP